MTFWSWLLQEVLGAAFSALNQWLSGQQAHADAVTIGQQNQKIADDAAAVAAAQAMAKAAANAQKTVEQTAAALDKGQF